jgi:hypothetical protein
MSIVLAIEKAEAKGQLRPAWAIYLKKQKRKKRKEKSWAHACCNPSYSEGRDQKD